LFAKQSILPIRRKQNTAKGFIKEVLMGFDSAEKLFSKEKCLPFILYRVVFLLFCYQISSLN
jgi:hypothetical protein